MTFKISNFNKRGASSNIYFPEVFDNFKIILHNNIKKYARIISKVKKNYY